MSNNGTLIELSFDNDNFKAIEIWDTKIAKESIGEHEDTYNGGFYYVKIIREATENDLTKYKDKRN